VTNPALNRQRKLKERRDPIALPDSKDIEPVIARAPGRLGALIRASWLTGCRQDELVRAERSRLDHGRRQLTVRGKGNKVRVIDLDYGNAYELLRSQPVRIGCKWLFWHHQGEPYRNVSSRFAAIVKGAQKAAQREKVEFRPFRFHDLRHRHAVDWLKSGRNIYDLQQRLGHDSIKTTELYLKYLTPEEARAAKHVAAQFEAQVQRFANGEGDAG
jgi:integrase/recombinase XerD